MNSQVFPSLSGTIISSPPPPSVFSPQATERRKPHHESKKLIDRTRMAIKVTVITPIPITFHSVNSAGGVGEASLTHPVVIGFEEVGTLLGAAGRKGGEGVCTMKAVAKLDFVASDAAIEVKEWIGVVTPLVLTEDAWSGLVSIEETVWMCGVLGGVVPSPGRTFPPTNTPIRSRSLIVGMKKKGVAFVKPDRQKRNEQSASKV